MNYPLNKDCNSALPPTDESSKFKQRTMIREEKYNDGTITVMEESNFNCLTNPDSTLYHQDRQLTLYI